MSWRETKKNMRFGCCHKWKQDALILVMMCSISEFFQLNVHMGYLGILLKCSSASVGLEVEGEEWDSASLTSPWHGLDHTLISQGLVLCGLGSVRSKFSLVLLGLSCSRLWGGQEVFPERGSEQGSSRAGSSGPCISQSETLILTSLLTTSIE